MMDGESYVSDAGAPLTASVGSPAPSAQGEAAGGVKGAGTAIGDLFGGLDAVLKVPGTNIPALGTLGAVGDIMSGVGKLAACDENGNWDPQVGGGVGDLASGVCNLFGGPVAGGVAQAIGNGADAVKSFMEADEASGAEQEKKLDEAYSSVGDAELGALKAITAGHPLAAAVVNGGAALLDGLGALTGAVDEDAGFSAGDALGAATRECAGDKSIGHTVAGVLGLDGGAGMAVSFLTDISGAGYVTNLADAAVGGIVNTVGNLDDEDETKQDYWQSAKDTAWDAAVDLYHGRY
jgi:hypothetical protein